MINFSKLLCKLPFFLTIILLMMVSYKFLTKYVAILYTDVIFKTNYDYREINQYLLYSLA